MNIYNNKIKIILKMVIFLTWFWFFLWNVNAAIIESTTNGWPWTINSTWVWWRVPWINDDVIINWPVFLWSKNITINSLTNNSTLYKFKNYDNYNLIINWNFINNWNLWWRVTFYENNFYIDVKWDVQNNWLIKIIKSDIYWNIYNWINSKWTWIINLYWLNDKVVDKIIETVPWFDTELKLFNDIKLKNNINFVWKFNLDWHTIYLDEILEIYIKTIKWNWKIISNFNNWDNQTLKFESLNYFETNVENVEAISSIWVFKWRNIISDRFGFNGTIYANVILNWWKLSFCDDSTINWNVYLENVNLYLCPNSTSHIYELTINWDLYNDWIIWSTFIDRQNFNLNIKWDFLNKWEVKETLNSINLYWNLDNLNWVINTTVYLMWDKIQDYNNYLINIKWKGEIILADWELPNWEWTMAVNNSNKYLLLNNMVNNLNNIYWKVKWDWLIFDSDWTETKCINVDWCVNIKLPWESQIPTPTNLNQYIKSPLLEQEEIEVWSKIGKFQSGSWVIFETEIDNPEAKELRINLELNKKWETTTKYTYTSDYFTTTWKVFTKIPLEAWDYYWKLKIEDRDWNASEIIDFKDNGTDTDFSLFEWFEPYPYGFSFVNASPDISKLTWWISWKDGFFKDTREKNPWTKWEIMDMVFPIESFNWDKREYLAAFESLWLNNDKPTIFSDGICFWLWLSALTQYHKPEILRRNFPIFSNNIWTWYIFDKINIKNDTNNNYQLIWLDDNLKSILALQLYQKESNFDDKMTLSLENDTPIDILNNVKNNPWKYILSFKWKTWCILGFWCSEVWHAVIPYKVEWNKIYIWDNNVPFPFFEKTIWLKFYWTKQYIEIDTINNTFNVPFYNRDKFEKIWIVSIDEAFVDNTSLIWFNDTDTLYTINWNSDLLLVDVNWNKTWYKNWEIYEEIPWTRIVVNYAWETTYNTWKQIYLPQKLENLSIEINGKTEENYELMIAWWDYYTKLEWISTSSWQTDTFNISRENIKIDFDDIKTSTWTYNLLIDDFQNNSTWSIYIHQLEIIKEKQSFDIDWNKVTNEEDNSISYFIDINNDWTYDIESNFNSLPKSENETWSISWQVISSPSNAWYKVCIDLNNNSKCEENIERFIVTDNTWSYKFDNLSKWNYTIIQEPRNNWEIIKPFDKRYTIKLNNWQNIVNLNFENQKINWNKNNKK